MDRRPPQPPEDFKKFLDEQDLEISLLHRIALGKQDEDAPLIYDIDFCPRPTVLKGKDAINAVAVLSTSGTNVYFYPKLSQKWTSMVIKGRPSSKGKCLRWHRSAKYIATTSDSTDLKSANVTLLSYDQRFAGFKPSSCATVLGSSGTNKTISSLAWVMGGQNLVVTVFPSAQFCFLKFDEKKGLLTNLGTRKWKGFPENYSIALQPHPTEDYFFACSEGCNKIMICCKSDETDENKVRWEIMTTVKSDTGLRAMSYSKLHHGLITMRNESWIFWAFDNYDLCPLRHKFESCDEHTQLRGRKLSASKFLSLKASTEGRYITTGGTKGTFIANEMQQKKRNEIITWRPAGSRKTDFSYGQVYCIAFSPFNQKHDAMMLVATGGNSGFVHIWGLYKKNSSTPIIPTQERRNEPFFYSSRQQDIRLMETVVDDGDSDDDRKPLEHEGEEEAMEVQEVHKQ